MLVNGSGKGIEAPCAAHRKADVAAIRKRLRRFLSDEKRFLRVMGR